MASCIYAGDGGAFKTCSQCGGTKVIGAFYSKASGSFGVRGKCKECVSANSADRYLRDRDSIRAQQRIYAQTNPHIGRERNRRWRAKNPERARELDKAWREQNADKKRASNRASYLRNKERVLERSREWREKNPEKAREVWREYYRRNPEKAGAWRKADPDRWREYKRQYEARRLQNPQCRIENNVRAAIWRTVARRSKAERRTFELLGYSAAELMAHLERQFLKGMSWENYGYGPGKWHIDHIVPLASFSYETPDDPDFKAAWALTNLRPLWSEKNISKGARRTHLL